MDLFRMPDDLRGPMTARVINVALIGSGEVAMTVHLPTLLHCSDMYKTVALVDVSPATLRHCSSKFHVSKTFTDVEYHVAHAVQCLCAGKHVFVEKPMSLTLGGADEIEAARRASGKVVFVGYMRRYAEAFLRVKEMVKALPEGSIKYVRVRDLIGANHFFVSQSGAFPKYFSDVPEAALNERKKIAAIMLKDALGSRALDLKNHFTWNLLSGLASHDLSAMRELIGMPKKVLQASRSPDGRFIWVMFQYDGFIAYYEVCPLRPTNGIILNLQMGIDQVRTFDAHIEVYAGDKRIKVTYDTPFVKGLPITASVLSSKPDGDHSEETIRPTYEDAYTLEYKALYAAIVEGAEVKTTPLDARQDMKMFTMIMEAMTD